ncbi:MAG: hypothetical protein KBC00_02400 [Candidatus Levybacteria bacterium]|nr:hypothetical protein [Candidatus Levybacteria bacterium]MBP9815424.1 hypothetical protein [Candidatus Levybacteria bacterium]
MDTKDEQKDLPTATEALLLYQTQGTVVEFLEKDIEFKSSGQSAVKSLKVIVLSTESQDMAILHNLHTKTYSL